MDNTEKLLRAFIEAQGYEIEKIYNQRKYNYECALAAETNAPFLKTHEDFIDYKVTKKQKDKEAYSMAELIAHSDAWNAICDYVLAHKEDIESNVNDFETLKPVWDFFNRNTKPFTFEDIKHEFGESELQ